MFLLSPFFNLHFSEGHIVFRTFYFLPWILYLSKNMRFLKELGALLALLVWQLLDGGIYPFYFSIFILILNLCWPELLRILTKRENWPCLGMMLLSALLLLAPKVLPVLYLHRSRVPEMEEGAYTLQNLLTAFFDMRLKIDDPMPGLKYHMHEYAHYVGVSLSLMFLGALYHRTRKLILFQVLIFLWMALGIGNAINPYAGLKWIPFINQIHVQSRFMILAFLMALWAVIESIGNKKITAVLLPIAVAELLYSNIYSSWHAFVGTQPAARVTSIQSPVLANRYDYFIPKPDVYSSGALSYHCYEPALTGRLFPKLETILSSKKMEGVELRVWPNSLEVHSKIPLVSDFALNFRWNGGWSCEGCDLANNQGLIEVHPQGSRETLKLTYDPPYWPLILVSYLAGLVLFIYLTVRVQRDL